MRRARLAALRRLQRVAIWMVWREVPGGVPLLEWCASRRISLMLGSGVDVQVTFIRPTPKREDYP